MEQTRYAGFWIRLIADFLDSLILDIATCVGALMVLGGGYWVKRFFHAQPGLTSPFDLLDPFVLQVLLVSVRVFLSLFYYSLGTYWYGTTLGKRWFNIYVVSYPSLQPVGKWQSLVRFLGYGVSYLPFGMGFLMVAFHPQKRGLHDLIAGTASVIRAN
jgi:uncharacterized RDD family membrane protein YckC